MTNSNDELNSTAPADSNRSVANGSITIDNNSRSTDVNSRATNRETVYSVQDSKHEKLSYPSDIMSALNILNHPYYNYKSLLEITNNDFQLLLKMLPIHENFKKVLDRLCDPETMNKENGIDYKKLISKSPPIVKEGDDAHIKEGFERFRLLVEAHNYGFDGHIVNADNKFAEFVDRIPPKAPENRKVLLFTNFSVPKMFSDDIETITVEIYLDLFHEQDKNWDSLPYTDIGKIFSKPFVSTKEGIAGMADDRAYWHGYRLLLVQMSILWVNTSISVDSRFEAALYAENDDHLVRIPKSIFVKDEWPIVKGNSVDCPCYGVTKKSNQYIRSEGFATWQEAYSWLDDIIHHTH